MSIHTLTRTQFFPLPLSEVFPFFESPENLGSITPSWLKFRIDTPLPVVMKEGTTIDYTISWLGLPMRWQTRIDRYNPPYEFIDTQVRGPYALWEHSHRFADVNGGTEMIDKVRYAMPFGPLGSLAHMLFIRAQLRRIFDYRAALLARRFDPRGLAVSMEQA